jgi:hypothetical protein
MDSRLHGNDKKRISGVYSCGFVVKVFEKTKPICSACCVMRIAERSFCQWLKRLTRPFGPCNDNRISVSLWLSVFVAI